MAYLFRSTLLFARVYFPGQHFSGNRHDRRVLAERVTWPSHLAFTHHHYTSRTLFLHNFFPPLVRCMTPDSFSHCLDLLLDFLMFVDFVQFLFMPRPRRGGGIINCPRLSVLLSVRPSVCGVPRHNSRTERPISPKLGGWKRVFSEPI